MLCVVVALKEAKHGSALGVEPGDVGPIGRAEDKVLIGQKGLGMLALPLEEPHLNAVAAEANDDGHQIPIVEGLALIEKHSHISTAVPSEDKSINGGA